MENNNKPRIKWEVLKAPVGGIIDKKLTSDEMRRSINEGFDRRRRYLLGIIGGAIITCLGTGFAIYEIIKNTR